MDQLLKQKLLVSLQKNETFRYYSSDSVADTICRSLLDQLEDSDIDFVTDALAKVDYRWLAFFPEFRRERLFGVPASSLSLEEFESYCRERLSLVPARGQEIAFQVTSDLNKLFAESLLECTSVHFYEDSAWTIFESLFQRSERHLGDFIDQQLDLPGINSLVRRGLVKSLNLTSGLELVAKKNNSLKSGKFLNEQLNFTAFKEALGLISFDSELQLDPTGVKLKIIHPLFVFRDCVNGYFYNVSKRIKGRTLEEALRNESDAARRKVYLQQVRQLLELLYEKGIIWNDMAPRNIIVEDNDGERIFHLLDFEKAKTLGRSATDSERVEHCRGPICLEEFGAICSYEEVLFCFDPYFKPESWDFASDSPISLPKPKSDYLEMLANLGREPTMGHYNWLEYHIMKIRFPYFDPEENATIFPLYTGFKVDHYLGPRHDRKVSEILLKSLETGTFRLELKALREKIAAYEDEIVLEDFLRSPAASSIQALIQIAEWIDARYQIVFGTLK